MEEFGPSNSSQFFHGPFSGFLRLAFAGILPQKALCRVCQTLDGLGGHIRSQAEGCQRTTAIVGPFPFRTTRKFFAWTFPEVRHSDAHLTAMICKYTWNL